jgi:hypothetical protein
MKSKPDPEALYAAVTDDFLKLLNDLVGDVVVIQQHLRKHDSQTWRRLFVRSAFSTFECTIAYLKAHVLVVRKFDPLALSRTELKTLREYYTFTDKRGKVKRAYFHLSFLKDVVFTLELFAYASYLRKKVNTSSPGWQALQKLVATRNRITHPKKPSHITLSDSEMRASRLAVKWFFDTVSEFHEECLETLQKQLEGMQRAIKRMKRSERAKGKNVQNNFT